MADESNKIGRISDDGIPEYPDVTLSGRPYDFPPAHVKMTGEREFVVLDVSPAKGFDVEAEIAKLKAPPAEAMIAPELVPPEVKNSRRSTPAQDEPSS